MHCRPSPQPQPRLADASTPPRLTAPGPGPSRCTAGTRPAWWHQCSAARRACRAVVAGVGRRGGKGGGLRAGGRRGARQMEQGATGGGAGLQQAGDTAAQRGTADPRQHGLEQVGGTRSAAQHSTGQGSTAQHSSTAGSRQHGLEQVGGVHGAVALARAHNVVDLWRVHQMRGRGEAGRGVGGQGQGARGKGRRGTPSPAPRRLARPARAPPRPAQPAPAQQPAPARRPGGAAAAGAGGAPSMKSTIWPWLSCTSLITAFSRSSNSPRYLAPAISAPMSSAISERPCSGMVAGRVGARGWHHQRAQARAPACCKGCGLPSTRHAATRAAALAGSGRGSARPGLPAPAAPPRLQRGRHVARHDALRQALRHRRLAHARLADQHRVVLGAARQDLDGAPHLVVPAGRAGGAWWRAGSWRRRGPSGAAATLVRPSSPRSIERPPGPAHAAAAPPADRGVQVAFSPTALLPCLQAQASRAARARPRPRPRRPHLPITGSSLPSRAACVRSRPYLASASYLPSGFWS